MTILRSLILVLFISGFSACTKDEDPCEKCNAAIQHMCGKIQENACNPEFMENAVERLRNDCGFSSGSTFAGYMAHTCAFQSNLDCGTCISEDGDIKTGHLSIANVPFQISASAINPDEVLVEVYRKNRTSSTNGYLANMEQGTSISFDSVDPLFDGEIISVLVMDFAGQDTLTQGEATIRFARPGNWINLREILVRYSFDTDEYVVEFERW